MGSNLSGTALFSPRGGWESIAPLLCAVENKQAIKGSRKSIDTKQFFHHFIVIGIYYLIFGIELRRRSKISEGPQYLLC